MEMRFTIAKASRKQDLVTAALFAALAIAAVDARAQQTEEEIAKAALNPIAAMISLPFQYNYDQNFGRERDGHKNQLNIQPVIPLSLNENWNLISRTIVPVIDFDFGSGGSRSGIGDITQSFFFSPKALTESGWTWGAGPVIYIPSATNDLGADKWGFGPTAVFLKQEHGWTVGLLANHIWSTGGSGRADISSTFLQPFLKYTLKSLTSIGVNTESTYDWKHQAWSVPIHFTVDQFFKVGEQKMTLQAGATYWATTPETGAHGWGFRVNWTLLFPR
jgi:Putative MetA-pathway of phenol degradation